MRSLGERLVARLKSWRSRKSALPDEKPDAGPETSKSPEQLDPILPTRLSIKVTTNDPDEVSDKATRQAERGPLQEVLPSAEEPPVHVKSETKEERPEEAITLPPVTESPQKQRRVRKPGPKKEDSRVTDEELEELEAENARLKVLLNERLQAKQDGSGN